MIEMYLQSKYDKDKINNIFELEIVGNLNL